MKFFQTIFVTTLLFIVNDAAQSTTETTVPTTAATTEMTTAASTAAPTAAPTTAATTAATTAPTTPTTTTKSPDQICAEAEICYYDIYNFDEKWCGEQLVKCSQNGRPTNPSTDDLCLDMVTPLRNQPRCDDDATLSSCSDSGGMCYDGYCCSKLRKREVDHFMIPDEPFRTNISCSPYHPLPFIFSYAFCNPLDSKVWTVGLFDPLGVKLRSNLKVCATNAECEEEYVCVNMIQKKRLCYFDPSGEWQLDYFAAVVAFFPLLVILIILGTLFVYSYKHL